MTTYNLTFDVPHVTCENFKEKHVYMLNRNIEEGRLGMLMKFSSNANISFAENDNQHLHPIITEQDKFNRVRTNCLIYDLTNNEYNPGYYDKLFVYHSLTKKNGWFGYIFYNTITGKQLHKYYVDLTDCGLITTLHKSFRLMLEQQTVDFMKENNG